MFQNLYELNYRKEQFNQNIPELPVEFEDVMINIPYTSQGHVSKLLLILADQLIKTGTAIKNTQVQLNKQETYKY